MIIVAYIMFFVSIFLTAMQRCCFYFKVADNRPKKRRTIVAAMLTSPRLESRCFVDAVSDMTRQR